MVGDLLQQNNFAYTDFPEIVDLAVISTGLGILQSNFGFVKQAGKFWDSTYWFASPRPFLDSHGVAYASAVAAWMRGEKDPAWAGELPNEIKRPMRKSLKYLFGGDDSFLDPSTAGQSILQQSQNDWLKMAAASSISRQIIALRHLQSDASLQDQQETVLLEKLRSADRPIVLHAISAAETLELASDRIVSELSLLVDSRDDETRAKALITLVKLGRLDEMTLGSATKMVDGSARHVVFAGVYALSSIPTVTDEVLQVAERGFIRALQTCDYEFVSLYAAAFNRWLDNPESHFRQLLEDDQPEYLQIATEALQNVREQSAA